MRAMGACLAAGMISLLVADAAIAQPVTQTPQLVPKPAPGIIVVTPPATAKETRDDRDLARQGKAIATEAKQQKLAQDNAAIDAGKEEAAAKAESAMNAANTALTQGAASAATQLGAARTGTGTATKKDDD